MTAPGVILPEVQLQTSKFTFPEVGYAAILRPPLVDGAYPVIALIEVFGVHAIASVVATPVAAVVTTVAQVADDIEPVPKAEVPLATVFVVPPVGKFPFWAVKNKGSSNIPTKMDIFFTLQCSKV